MLDPTIGQLGFRPMEAAKEFAGDIQTPCIFQPKLDGIRCVTAGTHEAGGRALSRSLKLIPNRFIQSILSQLPVGLDGELMLVDRSKPTMFAAYNDAQSAIMSEAGEPEFQFIVFDVFSPSLVKQGYAQRMLAMHSLVEVIHEKRPDLAQYVQLIRSERLSEASELPTKVTAMIDLGWEGAMSRHPDGLYKFGRSTPREQWLVKHKRFHRMEAVITGAIERMKNTNEATVDARGLTKRSSAAAGKVPAGVLGALSCQLPNGVTFEVGSGFDDAQRRALWEGREYLAGKTITVQYQELSETGAPRFPTFVGFRTDL